jgi:hypothetical protein
VSRVTLLLAEPIRAYRQRNHLAAGRLVRPDAIVVIEFIKALMFRAALCLDWESHGCFPIMSDGR